MARGLLDDPSLSRSMLLPFGKRTHQDYIDDVSEYDELELALPSAIADPLGRGGLLVKQALTGQRMNPNDATQAMIDVGMLSTPVGLLGGVPKGAVLGANVFQGGPHKYGPEGAAESLKHMSKGEGAQAYGWGRYDAQSEGVARQYKQNLGTQGKVIVDGQEVKTTGANALAAAAQKWDGDPMENLNNLKPSTGIFNKEAIEEAKLLIKRGGVEYEPGSFIYKHDLPDEDIARYLDWDAPLSEQPESVRGNLLGALSAKANGPQEIGVGDGMPIPWNTFNDDVVDSLDEMSGSQLHKMLTSKEVIGYTDKEASEFLGKAGIPGLKYFDGMSRYIDPEDAATKIPILEKYEAAKAAWEAAGSKGLGQEASKFRGAQSRAQQQYPGGAIPTSKSVKELAAKKRTRNFVTWDQDVLNRMKLLERNGEKFDGLLGR